MIPHPDAYYYEAQQRQIERKANALRQHKPISRFSVYEKLLLASGAFFIGVGTRIQQRTRHEHAGQPNIVNP